MEEISGYSFEEVQGLDWFNTFLPKRDWDSVRNMFAKAVSNIQTKGNVNPIITKDGQERQIEWYDKTLKDSEGNVVGLLAIGQDISERQRAVKALEDYQEQLRSLASNLTIAENQERHRIAMELHDELGQTLALLKLKLGEIDVKIKSDELSGQFDYIKSSLDSAIQTTRSLTGQLSPPILYELGLEPAVESLCEQLQEQYPLTIEFSDDGEHKPLSEDMRGLLYRGVRGLLLNVVKHANASLAMVSIFQERHTICISVEDNGVGFLTDQIGETVKSFGLFSVRERLVHLGGNFDITSEPGKGTRVILTAPLDQTEYESQEV
ncbi:MAG: sensor histidine kinase [Chloroflexi bacterium]|nr:sensor histidine kinase [Chloroflexota bacterium]